MGEDGKGDELCPAGLCKVHKRQVRDASGAPCGHPIAGASLGPRASASSPGGPRPAVFLDRDGVINENLDGTYVHEWAAFRFLPGTVEAIAALHRAGYPVVVVTNQAGIAHGHLSAASAGGDPRGRW